MAPTKTGGDDLDDGLEIDHDLIAQSDNDEEGSIVSDGEDGNYEGYMTDEEDKGPRVTGQKRKVNQDDEDDVKEVDEEARKAEKKKRRKEKDKERKAKVTLLHVRRPRSGSSSPENGERPGADRK